MNIKELKEKNGTDLRKTLFDLREELRNMRFDLSFGKVSNVAKIKSVKRDIARTLSVLNQKDNK